MKRGLRSRALRTVLAAVAAAGIATLGAAPVPAAASALQPIQLVAEQDVIMPGGTVTFYVVYHAKSEAGGEATASVRLPEGADLVDLGTGIWDEDTRTVTWDFGGVEAGGATAVRFQAKISEAAAFGDVFQVDASAALGASIEVAAPKVAVTVGTDSHQPFLQGYPDGTFRPEGKLTRAETAAAIARIRGLQDADGPEFADVSASHWAYPYIQQMSAEGYMIGYDGTFRPEEPITKGELAALMLRLRGISVVPLESSLSETIDDWSKFAVGTAETLGLIAADGIPFDPGEPIERQLAAKWLSVGLQRGPLDDGRTAVEAHFPDVTASHPYFRWIEEASSVAHEAEDRGDFREYLLRYLPEETNPF